MSDGSFEFNELSYESNIVVIFYCLNCVEYILVLEEVGRQPPVKLVYLGSH